MLSAAITALLPVILAALSRFALDFIAQRDAESAQFNAGANSTAAKANAKTAEVADAMAQVAANPASPGAVAGRLSGGSF